MKSKQKVVHKSVKNDSHINEEGQICHPPILPPGKKEL